MAGQRPYSSQPEDDLDYLEWPASINSLGNPAGKPPRPERRKPMVRLVCPICAAMVMVNALEVAGSTDSRCSKCHDTTITIETDDEGRIIGIIGYENSEGKVQKEKKTPDWRMVGGVAAAVLALMLFMMMLNAARSSDNGREGQGAASGELASPVKSAVPEPSGQVTQTPPDLFAPSQQR